MSMPSKSNEVLREVINWANFSALPDTKKAFRRYPVCTFFFRPTPLGFRQVVQHVRLHVAEMSELVN